MREEVICGAVHEGIEASPAQLQRAGVVRRGTRRARLDEMETARCPCAPAICRRGAGGCRFDVVYAGQTLRAPVPMGTCIPTEPAPAAAMGWITGKRSLTMWCAIATHGAT